MTGTQSLHGGRRVTAMAFVLYAVFLVTAQFEHHDFACHLKTPQHCGACVSSPLSSDPHALVSSTASGLSDSGRLVVFHRLSEGALLPTRSSGRSPPLAL